MQRKQSKSIKLFKKPFAAATTALIIAVIVLAVTAIISPKVAENPTDAPQTAQEEPTSTKISILAVGDNLIHGPIHRQAKARGNGAYDFSFAYEQIVPYLADYDFKLINQETPLGGEELGLSSYPLFNSPTQLGDYLVSVGFNLVSHANNHVLDAGEHGLANTINYWKNQTSVTMAGVYANSEEAANLQIVEKDNVKIAFLAYTYGTNGLSLPADAPEVINYIDKEKMQSQIAQAEAVADITLVMMHWGVEYQPQSNAEQQELAQMMANADVDIIIGSHPHVIQEVTTLEQPDGGKCVCFYSLGNFISAQDKPATMLGGMASVKLKYQKDTKQINYESIEFIPIVNQFNNGYTDVHIIPLAKYTDEDAAAHGVSGVSCEYFQNLLNNTVSREFISVR